MADENPYAGLEPAELWRHFAALNAIPRPPGHEAAAREYVRHVADAYGAEFLQDGHGNALVRVSGRGDLAEAEPVAVQAHLDMVCDSAPGVQHDFTRDPILTRREGDRISARDSTLGADNGIGVAAALALLTEPDLPCGPLELLFTVEEEIGLYGALALDAGMLRARSLINLDSEDDDALTVGCAGGADVKIRLALEQEPLDAGWSAVELRVSGLTGGHSGVQIHEHRANAIKQLVAVIDRLRDGRVDVRLSSLTAGTAHNAIPLAGAARLAIASGAIERARELVREASSALTGEWSSDEPGLTIALRELESPVTQAANAAASERLLSLLRELPHGVLAMSEAFPGTVATSINLAIVATDGAQVEVQTSARSVSAEVLAGVVARVQDVARENGGSAQLEGGYPGWEPRPDSPLLAAAARAYERVHGTQPKIEVVHGGLECGALIAKVPDLDAVSFGPRIREAHTPREHVYASTVTGTWQVLLTLLEELALSAG
ncbi:MAG TPA: beta-Ala-His dipeptidase [Solirubrobacteraceae bacterium]